MHLCLCGVFSAATARPSIRTLLMRGHVYRTGHSLSRSSIASYLNNPFQIANPICLIARNSVCCQYFPPCWLTASNYSIIMSHWLFSSSFWLSAFFPSCHILTRFQQMYVCLGRWRWRTAAFSHGGCCFFFFPLHLLAPITGWVQTQALLWLKNTHI